MFLTIALLTCSSISASHVGDWKPIASAPRDGTVIEYLETYGVAPTYGRIKWTKDTPSLPLPDGTVTVLHSDRPSWVNVDKTGFSQSESECLFWRPYKGPAKYVDPTNGRQDTVEYWCAYVHATYDPKTGYCKR